AKEKVIDPNINPALFKLLDSISDDVWLSLAENGTKIVDNNNPLFTSINSDGSEEGDEAKKFLRGDDGPNVARLNLYFIYEDGSKQRITEYDEGGNIIIRSYSEEKD
ncbi:MAG: hypothetical protein LBD99_04620, partial [Candidatus Margulisbacteria bacterium]|nr:hypothetical protein [Candidatus Margulisiibacteriota bacterium]